MPIPKPVAQFLDGSIDAAVVLDRELRIVYFNSAYQALSRRSGRVLALQVEKGLKCHENIPLSICKTACVGRQAQSLGRPLRVDEIEVCVGDDVMTFIVAAIPLADGLTIEVFRDVTAEARIQRRLRILVEREREANKILEETVAARTRELKQAQAQLVLQEKMSALGRLVAGIAHELNNPINFVYGNVDFLSQYLDDLVSLARIVDESNELPAELRKQFEERKRQIEFDYLVEDSSKLIASIRSGAERTASIVRDLRNFSRTGGNGRTELKEVDLVAGIESTLNLIGPLLKGRIDIERDYQTDIPHVVCNAGHVNQVFMNLLTNAAQAIDGTGVISISVDTVDEGRAVRIRVSDTGRGIDEEIRDSIADPFFTTKEVGEGTGLGLWIAQSIVKNHGGTLEFESAIGKGTTFSLVLPVEPPADGRPDQDLTIDLGVGEKHV